MAGSELRIETEFAEMAVQISDGTGFPVVLLHGNSSSREVFSLQMASAVATKHRTIAIDLPGHGASSDAYRPETTYSMIGYADAVASVLQQLGVEAAVVFGWSLGGHVGIELLRRFPGMAGLMMSGTPPVNPTPESIGAGFQLTPLMALLGQETIAEADREALLLAIYDGRVEGWARDALLRTDGRARRILFETLFTGQASQQRELVETAQVPVAIVDGEREPFANLNYIAGLTIPALWEAHDFVLRDAGHDAFRGQADRFNAIFARFVDDAADRWNRKSGAKRSGFAAA